MDETEICEAHLVLNTDTLNNLEESLAKSTSIICVVESGEANDRTDQLPVAWSSLFDPVCGDHKVAVDGTGLPCITCEADLAGNLRLVLWKKVSSMSESSIQVMKRRTLRCFRRLSIS